VEIPLPENAQIRSAQNPAKSTSEAAYSNANWQSDFDALNSIQYILYLMSTFPATRTWSDAIQNLLNDISHCSTDISHNALLCGPFRGLNASDAAKLIAPFAAQNRDLYPEPPPNTPYELDGACWINFNYIVNDCKDIDPSSVS
jgi:hypothetical protein